MMLEQKVRAVVEEVRREHAPDPRLSVFEIEVGKDGDTLSLDGAVSEAAAAEALHRRLGALDGNLRVVDRIVRLPHGIEDDRAYALVTAAVAPMLAGPMIVESHVSQVLLGHCVRVLRRSGRWMQCRAQDGYLGWIHRGYLHRVDESAARAWEMGVEGVPCMSLGGQVVDGDGEVVARLPWGARLIQDPEGRAVLPDGTSGPFQGELLPLPDQPSRYPADGEAMVRTADRWIGAPYLWGGTTPAGVDCSGLAQAVYRTHGRELPRDSDQQAEVGAPVDPGRDFQNLRAGDLLFFAEIEDRITHVTLSTGGADIIHSSLGNGGVRRNSLTGELPFEKELRRIFVCARRPIND